MTTKEIFCIHLGESKGYFMHLSIVYRWLVNYGIQLPSYATVARAIQAHSSYSWGGGKIEKVKIVTKY